MTQNNNNSKQQPKQQDQSTQSYIPIAEIRDNVAVLSDGSLRQVIKITPVSVELRSQQEQESVVYQYRSFLNALNFPIQIVIQGRRVDLSLYLQKLNTIGANETNELIKVQIVDYIDFIERLSNEVNIMDRSYYVVILHSKSASQSDAQKKTFVDRLLGGKKTEETVFTESEFKSLVNQINEKSQIVTGRLSSFGIKSEVLTTKELIELYYNTYNPEEATTEHVGDTEDVMGQVIGSQKTTSTNGNAVAVADIISDLPQITTIAPPISANTDGSLPIPPAPQASLPTKNGATKPGSDVTPITTKKTLKQIFSSLGVAHEKTEAELEAEIFKKGLTDVLDIISPAGLLVNSSDLQIGNFFARTLFLYTYPRYLSSGWLSPILNFDTTIDISMFVYPEESSILLSQLRRKTTQLQSSLQVEQEKGLVRNPELETAIGDIEQLRDSLQKGETRLFQFSMYLTVYAKSRDELQKLSKQIESSLGGILVYTKTALFQMESGFNSTMPIGKDELQILRNLDSDSLATTFPFSSQDLSHHDGVLYGINLHNSSLVLYDRFRMENANQVVFAKSGAGKSYAIKLEILRSLMLGTEVIIIDPENEYLNLSQTVGGSYVSISLNSGQKINPFDLPKFDANNNDTGEDLLRSTIAGLHGLIALMAGTLSPEEDALLDKALYEVYALKDITIDPKSQNNQPPLLSDLVGVLANMTGAEELMNRLLKYSEGSFSNLFNAPTNIDLNNRVTTFSIKNMEDELRPLAMYLVLNYIWGRVKSSLKRRILAIDEAWWMMRHEDTAKFLNAMVKRSRKYYLGVTIISQDVEDFIENDYGRAIVSNSATQLLLGQSPTAIDKLAEIFKLTDGEKQFLTTADVGQGLLIAGIDRAAIQVIASYAEDKFITTNPEQVLEMLGQEAS